MVVSRGYRERGMGTYGSMGIVSDWEDEKHSGNGWYWQSQQHKCTQCQWTAHLKIVNSVMHILSQ